MRPSALPTSLGAAFSVDEALRIGVTRDRLRASDLRIAHRGVRARDAVPGDLRGRACALRPLLVDGRRISHLSAAALHGMRLPEGMRAESMPLHVTYRDAARGMRRPGGVGHRSRAVGRVVITAGIPLSHPIDAWLECASLLTVDDLAVMGDGLLRRRQPMASAAELEAAIRRNPGRRGIARLRAAMEIMRPDTDSARETMVRLVIVRSGLPEPVVNAALTDDNGDVVGHGDLTWPDRRLVVEYEGRQHAEDPAQFAIDIRRQNRIAEAGYRTVRVDRDLFRDRRAMLRTVSVAFHATEESRRRT